MTAPVPRAFRGGADEMLRNMAFARAEFRKALSMVASQPDEKAGSIAEFNLYPGLFDLWEGRTEEARGHLVEAAKATLRYGRPPDGWLSPSAAADSTKKVVQGAIAAQLTGNGDLAVELFKLASLIGSGVSAPGEDLSPEWWEYIHDPTAQNPLHHAYALIRLGQLSGFKTSVYTVSWPEAKRVKPVWMETDVRTLLQTAQVVIASSRAVRTHVFMPEAELSILLDMLMSCIERPDDKAARAAAQKRLGIFYDKISDMGEFEDMYPLVLDLQDAFPQIFKPVVPNPLRTP